MSLSIKATRFCKHMVVSLTLSTICVAVNAASDDPLKLGLVSFYSGGASGPVGIPSRNGADVIIKAINEGTLPGSYSNSGKGAGGRPVAPVYSDEAVDSAARVTEYRNLVQRQGVDAVIGYASSGSCLAITPVAEELKTLTLLYYCGSTRIFEEGARKYVFRTMASQDVENIAAARYITSLNPKLKSISGMNQNYAWGQDSWRDFKESLDQIKPAVSVKTKQFPKIFAGQYGAELTALARSGADVVHSSFWGGDMEALILQGAPRGVFDDQTLLLTTGGTAFYSLADQIPEGTVIGARGQGDMFAPESELNTWFRNAYKKAYGENPTFPAYYMAQSVLALKAAADKAAKAKGGAPAMDEVRAAMKGIEYASPAGTIKMARANGHQAITGVGYGTFTLVDGKPSLKNVRRYSAECVNPPAGTSSSDWIKSGFLGAQCKQ